MTDEERAKGTIESILFRRAVEHKLQGYTKETAEEIAAALRIPAQGSEMRMGTFADAPKDRILLVTNAGGFGEAMKVCWHEADTSDDYTGWLQVDYHGTILGDEVGVISFDRWLDIADFDSLLDYAASPSPGREALERATRELRRLLETAKSLAAECADPGAEAFAAILTAEQFLSSFPPLPEQPDQGEPSPAQPRR